MPFFSLILQANSPIKTLDELHVCEVPPALYFPSIEEREHMMPLKDPLSTLPELHPTGADFSLTGYGHQFGLRRRHRCYIITARARSFLYHQVTTTVFNSSNSMIHLSILIHSMIHDA